MSLVRKKCFIPGRRLIYLWRSKAKAMEMMPKLYSTTHYAGCLIFHQSWSRESSYFSFVSVSKHCAAGQFAVYSLAIYNSARHKGMVFTLCRSSGLPSVLQVLTMMKSSNGNICRVTGHLCGEFTGPRWIPRTKASDTELWCFLWSASE